MKTNQQAWHGEKVLPTREKGREAQESPLCNGEIEKGIVSLVFGFCFILC